MRAIEGQLCHAKEESGIKPPSTSKIKKSLSWLRTGHFKALAKDAISESASLEKEKEIECDVKTLVTLAVV